MKKEVIPQKQGTALTITFLFGSTLIMGAGSAAKQDSWISILISMLCALPIFFVYGRIVVLYPGKDFLFILEDSFGKILGKVVVLLYSWYAFHLGAVVIRNFVEFITIVSLPETPKYIVGIMMILVCIWGVKCGIEVLGRWTSIILPIMLLSLIIVSLLTIPIIKPDYLKPVMGTGIKSILKNAFSVFTFPFAEAILLVPVLTYLRPKSSPYKVYYQSLTIGGIFIALISVRSVAVLGVPSMTATYFSSYLTVSLIDIGSFIQRIEITVSIVFMFGGFIKICICLLSACTGLVRVLKIDDYAKVAAPVGLLMFVLSQILYVNTMEMFNWAEQIYPYYAIPFQIVFPLIILVLAELKRHKRKQAQMDKKELI